jgi:hypothetical protein
MSYNFQGKIATDGLIMYFDAKNPKSAQGTSWNDIKSSYVATTDASYNNNGYYEFDGTKSAYHDYIEFDSSTSWTFSQWQYMYTATSAWNAFCGTGTAINGYWMHHGTTKLWYYQDYYDSTYYGCTSNGHNNFDQFQIGVTIPEQTWFYLTISYNGNTSEATCILNNHQIVQTQPVQWSPRPITSFKFRNIGNDGTNRYFQGNIATHMVWNKILSSSEIDQTYNALKSRFNR